MELDSLLLERRVDALLAPWTERKGPGVALGVVRKGELVLHRGAGLASIEHGVPAGPGTRFRIASVSKQFTCAAILMLREEGKLSLDDPARRHLPELPDLDPGITVAHLMHNTSGIRDMLEIQRLGGADLGTAVDSATLLEGIRRQRRLNFAPGSRFLYSNSNFLLLGRIAEHLSGEPLPGFLERRIFAPLGMSDTRMVEDPYEAVPRLATGYRPGEGGGWARAPHGFRIGGEGGLVSSVEDLALWDRNFTTRRIGADWLDALSEQTPFNNGRENFYARGLIVRGYRGVRTVSHSGLWPGYRTEFLRVPGHEVTVIAITNDSTADPGALAKRVLDVILEERPGIRPARALPPPGELEALAGRYLDPDSTTTLDIAATGDGGAMLSLNGLSVKAVVAPDGRLMSPASSTALFIRPLGPELIEVEQDAGHVAHWHRVAPGAALPPGLAGTWRSEEMDAVWTIAPEEDWLAVRVRGPVVSAGPWRVEAVEGDVVRVHVPGTLMDGWLDVRLLRDAAGAPMGLEVHGGRAKRVAYQRLG